MSSQIDGDKGLYTVQYTHISADGTMCNSVENVILNLRK